MMLVTCVLMLVICGATVLGRSPPAPPSLGGYSAVSVGSEDVQNAAEFAVQEIQRLSNSQFELGVEKIVSAQTQTAAGTNTKLKLIVNVSNCRPKGYKPKKNDPPAPSYCSVTNFRDCEAVVYERSWENVTQLMSYSCKPSDYKRHYATGLIVPKKPQPHYTGLIIPEELQ